jgi:serine/threonine protein kinase
MQVMIKQYPVAFPDLKSGSGALRSTDLITQMRQGGLKEQMPSEFHDLIREMLVKDPSNRLGSESMITELAEHQFIKK